MQKYYEDLSLNYEEWIVKKHPLFEANIKGYPKQIITSIDDIIEELKKNPYGGNNLGPQVPHKWSMHVEIRYRLYYTLRERKRIIYLLAFYPRKLQTQYLDGKLT